MGWRDGAEEKETAKKMKFSIKYFFCKCDYDQSWSFVQFHSYVTKFLGKNGKVL